MQRIFTLLSIVLASCSGFIVNVCQEQQACRSQFLGNSKSSPLMSFCTCPQGEMCSDENSVVFKKTRYSFCQPVALPVCQDGELALEVELLTTSVYCTCPDSFHLQQMTTDTKQRFANIYFECVRMTV